MSTMVPLKDGSLVGVAALLFQMTLSLMILYKITEDCGVRASTLAPIASFGRERGQPCCESGETEGKRGWEVHCF